MKVRAGSLPPLELHRVQEEQIDSMESKYADSPMPYTDLEMIGKDGPEEMIALAIVLVLCIAVLVGWRLS